MNAVTLVAIIDCHASHNVRLENVNPEEKGYIKRFLKAHGYQVVERKAKPQEPTCDNCGHMTVRQTGSGNHRHCDLHTALQRFNDIVTGRRKGQRKENTLRKGGAQ